MFRFWDRTVSCFSIGSAAERACFRSDVLFDSESCEVILSTYVKGALSWFFVFNI